jgi:hypothetical protein
MWKHFMNLVMIQWKPISNTKEKMKIVHIIEDVRIM